MPRFPSRSWPTLHRLQTGGYCGIGFPKGIHLVHLEIPLFEATDESKTHSIKKKTRVIRARVRKQQII
jgi:hypothetical protein